MSPIRPVEGYCWPLSARRHESIRFMISGEGLVTVTIDRQRSVSDEVDPIFVEEVDVQAALQDVPAQPWRTGCGWKETFRYKIPSGALPGVYAATCRDAADNQCSIPFVVHGEGFYDIAVMANVNTWLAYNKWGGKGKYEFDGGAAHVSFLRPNPGAQPSGAPHLLRGELWILGWLDREQIRYDVITDIDFHNIQDGMSFNSTGGGGPSWKALIVGTHPEYWTLRMYDNLQRYLSEGGSLLYLGGNGIFENAEYTPDQTGMVFRAGVEQGPREVALFRLLNPPRHERAILGVATERSGVQGSPYVVEPGRAGHPLFQFTNLPEHGSFGDAGLNNDTLPLGYGNGKASGSEIDTSDGPGAVGLPAASGLHPDVFHVAPSKLPDGLTVLARGEPDDEGRGADMTIYNHAGGGFVFSAGSITFGGSLVIDPAMRLIVLNALGRAGVQAPALWVGADFNGDEKDDILFYYPPDDNWWLGSVTDGELGWAMVGNTSGFGHAISDGRPFLVADFNGDQKSEILFYFPGDDNWWLGAIAGGELEWTHVSTTHDLHSSLHSARFWTGDFSGDGREDLLVYSLGSHAWHLGTFTSADKLRWTLVGTTKDFYEGDDRLVWAADFTDDGKASVLFYYPGDDNWWLGSITHNELSWRRVGNTKAFGHNIQDGRPFWTGDFTGDGKTDVLFYYPGDDNWWLGSITDGALNWRLVGNTKAFGHNIQDGRPFWIADISGDGRKDVLFYYPGDDNWWLGSITDGALNWRLVGNTKAFGHNIQDGRPFWTATFSGQGAEDIMFYYPGDDNWWLGSLINGTLTWTRVGVSA